MPEAADLENEDSNSTTSPSPPPLQKRKHIARNAKKGGGRIARGQDFWSLVDAFLAKLVDNWGRILMASSWKS